MATSKQRRPWGWAAIAGGIVAMLVVVVSVQWPKGEGGVEEAREAARAELEVVDGGLRLIGDTNLFTGVMVESYPDGGLRSRSTVSNGTLHGLSEGWHTNGVIQVREFFTNGVSHGVRTKWGSQGEKLSEAQIRAGELHGLYQSWHENGQLAEQIEMKNGKPDGTAISFYSSGFVKGRALFEGGIVSTQTFWDDGSMKMEPTGSGRKLRTHQQH